MAGNLAGSLEDWVQVETWVKAALCDPGVDFDVKMPDNVNNRESSRESSQIDFSPVRHRRGRRTSQIQRDLFDLFEVLEAYAPVWYSMKLRRSLLAALRALNTRR